MQLTSRLAPLADTDYSDLLPTGGPRAAWAATGVTCRDGEWGLELEFAGYPVPHGASMPAGSQAPFNTFLALSRYSEEQLATKAFAFAQKYGPINFCECGGPWPCPGHWEVTDSARDFLSRRLARVVPVPHREGGKYPGGSGSASEQDPLVAAIRDAMETRRWQKAHWYGDLAKTFLAIHRAADRLKLLRRVEADDQAVILEAVKGLAPFSPSALEPITAPVLRRLLTWRVNRWLSNTGISLHLEWHVGEPRILIAQPYPFARLVTALAFKIYNASPSPICAACGRLAKRSRAPREGEQSWCPRDGCVKAKNRYHQRRRRSGGARSRNGRKLQSSQTIS